MPRHHALDGQERGSVFVTTMVAMLMMLLTGTYLYSMTDSGMHNVKQIQTRSQAKYLAEAGLSAAMADLRADWQGSGSYASVNLGTGAYTATVATTSGRTLITATGTVNGITQTTTAEVTAPGISALDYVFAGGGDVSVDAGTGQSSGTVAGDIYGGGNVDLDGPSSGGTMTFDGDVDAVGNITDGSNMVVNGTETPSFSQTVTFPTVNYAYYQAIATANGQYFSGDKTYTSGNLPAAPAGGVIFVNGNVTIQGTQSSTACIVATGNITISKSGSTYPRVTVTAPTVSGVTYPAFLSQGNFTFSSTGNGGAYLTVTGLLYSEGNFTYSSGNHDELTITGSVLARGDIDLSPTAWNITTAGYTSLAPPGFDLGTAEMAVESYNS